MGKDSILNFKKYLNEYEVIISSIIKDASYSEICNYIKLLPGSYETDDVLYYWVTNYINEYYQKIAALERIKNKDNEERILVTEKRLYTMYCLETYNYINISFKEFIVFSKLVDETFGNDDTQNIRVYDSNNMSLGCIFNVDNIISIKQTDEIPYTLNRLKLDMLHNLLYGRREEILKESVESSKFNEDNIDAIFSKKLAKKVKKLFK